MDTHNTSHPLGYWLQAADRFMAAELRSAFRREGVSRRDWRLLNVVDGSMPAQRPLDAHRLRGLLTLGWVAADEDGWILTDQGRAAKDRLSAIADEMRATVTDAVSPEDYATTVATLEKIATAFGWEEGKPLPRKRHGHAHARHGHGRHGHGHGRFAPFRGGDHAHADWHGGPGDHGDAHAHGHGPGDGFDSGCHHAHGGPRRRFLHDVYERGFDAGFVRGRQA